MSKKRGDMRLAQALAYLGLVIDRYHEAMLQLYEGPYDTDRHVADALMFLRGTDVVMPINEDYARKRRDRLILLNHLLKN